MDRLLAIIGKSERGRFAGKIVFDSRHKMPTQKEVLTIVRKYINITGIQVDLIEPPLSITGKYDGNYFDFIFNSNEEHKTKIFYENRNLIEDFKNNPINIWCSDKMIIQEQ